MRRALVAAASETEANPGRPGFAPPPGRAGSAPERAGIWPPPGRAGYGPESAGIWHSPGRAGYGIVPERPLGSAAPPTQCRYRATLAAESSGAGFPVLKEAAGAPSAWSQSLNHPPRDHVDGATLGRRRRTRRPGPQVALDPGAFRRGDPLIPQRHGLSGGLPHLERVGRKA